MSKIFWLIGLASFPYENEKNMQLWVEPGSDATYIIDYLCSYPMILKVSFIAIPLLFLFSATVEKGLDEAAGPTEQEVPDLDEDLPAGMITPLSNLFPSTSVVGYSVF